MKSYPRRITLAAAAVLSVAGAHAEVSPWYLGVLASVEHDTNIYRVGDNQVLPPGYAMGDTLLTGSLIGGLDQYISRQHVYGSVSLNDTRFRRNSYLNNTGYSLALGLDWAAAAHLSGSLTAKADRDLAQFNNRTATGAIETARNVQSWDRLDANVALGSVGRLTLEAGGGLHKRRYSAAVYQYLQSDEKVGSLGLKYRPSGALTVGTAYRWTRTNYPDFLQLVSGQVFGSRIDRRDLDLYASWTPTGASSLYLRLTPTRLSYEDALLHNRSALTGAATWAWQPSARSTLKAALTRDTGQSSQAYNFGIFGAEVLDWSTLTTAFKLDAGYDLTGKINLDASLVSAHRDIAAGTQVIGNPAPVLVEGGDRSLIPTLNLTWNPTRGTQLGCSVSRERRTTGNSAVSVALTAGTYRCFGQIVLQ